MPELYPNPVAPRVIAVADAGNAAERHYADYFARLKDLTDGAEIYVLMDGDLDRDGGLPAKDKYARARALRAAGAACVVEMPLPAQSLVDNLYAFAVRAMLHKLGGIDALAIPCAGDRETFTRTAAFLFNEPAPYQRRMRALRDEGEDLEAVFPAVVGEFVDGAAEFLARRQNRMAVEYANILKRTYSTVKPFWLEYEEPACGKSEAAVRRDAFALSRAAEEFLRGPEKEALARAEGMFSGSPRMARRIYDLLRANPEGGLTAFSFAAACADMNPAAVRRYLMSCLVGYRKLDSFVCITYSYIPYIRVLDAAPEALARVRETAGTTLIVDTPEAQDFSQVTDDYKQLLLKMDARARTLFVESEG